MYSFLLIPSEQITHFFLNTSQVCVSVLLSAHVALSAPPYIAAAFRLIPWFSSSTSRFQHELYFSYELFKSTYRLRFVYLLETVYSSTCYNHCNDYHFLTRNGMSLFLFAFASFFQNTLYICVPYISRFFSISYSRNNNVSH